MLSVYGVGVFTRLDLTYAVQSPSWWRHQIGKFSAVLGLCEGNSPVPGEFPAQRPVTRSFDVFFDLRLNKRLRKQSWGWWFETPSGPLWRHCNDDGISYSNVTFPACHILERRTYMYHRYCMSVSHVSECHNQGDQFLSTCWSLCAAIQLGSLYTDTYSKRLRRWNLEWICHFIPNFIMDVIICPC